MAKEHNFTASEILTPDTMNALTQDSQIVKDTVPGSNDDSLATTKWVRSASGNTSLNAATATHANHAANADHAVEANHSVEANHALRADHAIESDHADDADHARNADNAGHAGSATSAITKAISDKSTNIATTAFVKNVAYHKDNPPPNPLDDLRKVTFTWRKKSGIDHYIAATAEVICHKNYINWNYIDYELAAIGQGGIEVDPISIDTMVVFLKSLGYGAINTYNMGSKQSKMLPMVGLSKFLSYNSTIQPSDIIAGVYVNRDQNTLTYLTALNYTTTGLKEAEIYATVRRLI